MVIECISNNIIVKLIVHGQVSSLINNKKGKSGKSQIYVIVLYVYNYT